MSDGIRCQVNGQEQTLTAEQLAAMPPENRAQVAVWSDDSGGWVRPGRFQDTGEFLEPVEGEEEPGPPSEP